jgi:hypothetical protein
MRAQALQRHQDFVADPPRLTLAHRPRVAVDDLNADA